jgi:formate dehydrogenase maturation protein FdhE
VANTAKKCPDCGGEMVEGFILDLADSALRVPRWLRGSPERSAWTGVKTKDTECRPVETYRCTKCGLLRSYANTEVNPPGMWSQ